MIKRLFFFRISILLLLIFLMIITIPVAAATYAPADMTTGVSIAGDGMDAMYRSNPSRDGRYPVGSAPGSQLVQLWRSPIGQPGSDPVVSGNSVYVANLYGSLYSIDTRTGRQVWKQEIWNSGGINKPDDWIFISTPLVHQGKVFYHWGALYYNGSRLAVLDASDGMFVNNARIGCGVLDADICMVEPWQPSSPVPAGSGGDVQMGAPDGRIWWGDGNSVDTIREIQFDGMLSTPPAADTNNLYIGEEDCKNADFQHCTGSIYAVNAVSHIPVWSTDLKAPMFSSPVVADGVVYASVYTGTVFALDAGTGKILWQYNTGGNLSASPAVDRGLLFTIDETRGNLVALDSAQHGAVRWSQALGSVEGYVSPSIADGRVFIGTSTGKLLVFDEITGTKILEYQIPLGNSYAITSSPVIANGVIYLIAQIPSQCKEENTTGYLVAVGEKPQPPQIVWQKPFGGSKIDIGEFVAKTPDGGTIVAATTGSGDGDIANTGFHGVMDIVLSKFDKDHKVIWTRSYGGSDGMSLARHVLIEDDGYLVSGESFATNGDVIGHQGTNRTSDIWIFKTDLNGKIKWSRSYGGSLSEAPMWSELNSDKTAILLTGFTYSTDGVFTGLRSDPYSTDAFVMKINQNGDVLWVRVYGGSKNDQGNQIEESADGTRFYVAGTTWSNDGDVLNQNHGGNTGTSDGWVFALDPKGNLLWSRAFGGTLNEMFQGMDIADDGRILIVGDAASNDGDIPRTMKHGRPGRTDIWFLALNEKGQILLNNCYGGSLDEDGKSIRDDIHGNYYIQGSTNSNDGDVSFNHGGNTGTSDLWLLKLDSTGRIIWEKCFGGSGNDWGYRFGSQHLAPSDSSGYIIGETMSNDGDVEGFKGEADAWIVQLKGTAGDSLW